LMKNERATKQEVAGDTLQFEFARSDYERANEFLKAISNRILSMQTEQRAPERVEIFQKATTPTRPDQALPFRNMGIAAAVALVVPFGLAIGLEMLYRRVSSRYQLETQSQIAVVAEVTTLPTRAKGRGARGAIQSRDVQLFEESIDGLRTYLMLGDSLQSRQVIAVTSAVSREGKTSLACQLAVSLASATGRPTLLIDGDMRMPDIHRIFDVDRGPGLAEVLQKGMPVEEVIETGCGETLHLITSGVLRVSPHRILGNSQFTKLLTKLRETYENIIVDTPPILSASESLLMASAADATILCVRRDFSRIDQVEDAFGRLRSAGAKTAGAVLNGIPPLRYAYHYGTYYHERPTGGGQVETTGEEQYS
jgi:polysaccharide biosynthesis transport protein